jgi:hypothetical protein
MSVKSKKPDKQEPSRFDFEGDQDSLSSHKLVSHDMAVGFAKAIRRLESEDGDLHSWDDRIHYRRGIEEGVKLNTSYWSDLEEYEPGMDIDEVIGCFKKARKDVSDQESYEVLKDSLDDDIPDVSKEVIDRAVRVLDGARGIIELQDPEYNFEDDSVELYDALWAYDKADGVDLSLEGDLEYDEQIRGNEAHKYVTNTLTKNVYDNNVDGDTEVVLEKEDGVITVDYTSHLDEGKESISCDEMERGLGLNASESVVECFGGRFECSVTDEEFNISYELIPE